MSVPATAVIAPAKITDYLLVPRPWDDKAKFLQQAGFDLSRPSELEVAIRASVGEQPALPDGENSYGEFYRVESQLDGVNGMQLPVVTIWLRWHIDGSFHFVTLKPWRKQRS